MSRFEAPGKDPRTPGVDWTWARLRESHRCPLPRCGQLMTPEQNVIVFNAPIGRDERRELPFHPMCAFFVAARRIVRAGEAA